MSLSALEVPNVRHFIRFRVFFNARYYYPIFTILFLDFGITLEQFTWLNVIWTLTIVLAEVPSGALADLIGRRALLLGGAVLMLVEMSVLIFAPIGASGALLFTLFAINRICSGLAEAMVSGADEALTYDSLRQADREGEWTQVLEHLGKRVSLTMGLVMVTGALIYDLDLVNAVLAPLGLEAHKAWLIRVPLVLTALHGLVVLYSAWRMVEPVEVEHHGAPPLRRLGQSFVQVWHAAQWLVGHRFVLFVIFGGLILDSVARQYIILNSEYYRLIELPEFSFGFISAALAGLGFVFARINRYLADHRSPLANLLILAAVLLTGLIGVSFFIPYAGMLFVPFIGYMFTAVAFLQSHYINREVDSRQRATLLSFRGLANNLGLGIASYLYGALVILLKEDHPDLSGNALQDTVFREALAWFPAYFLLLLALVLLGGRLFIRRQGLATASPA